MKTLVKSTQWPFILFIAFVFIQSLFFKFTDAVETRYIFEGKLEPWAASLGLHGLFAKGGLFSAKVIGSFELLASILLLSSLAFTNQLWLRIIGATLGLKIITGAILLHLFTPLGVVVRNNDGSNDGGVLFMLACGVWLSCAALLYLNRVTIHLFLRRLFQKKQKCA